MYLLFLSAADRAFIMRWLNVIIYLYSSGCTPRYIILLKSPLEKEIFNKMSNICAIIAEYNPLTAGHRYHIKKARELSQSDSVAVILSGDFVQRGEPAIFSKFARASAAISAGADIVLELPVEYSCSYAENFAFGGVSIAKKIGASYLAFGSETADVEYLKSCASTGVLPSDEALMEKLNTGMTFAKARSEVTGIRPMPNDILGIEYLKAIERLGGGIEPIVVKRSVAGHDSDSSPENGEYFSALSLRNAIRNGEKPRLMPEFAAEKPVFTEDLTSMLLYRLRTMDVSELAEISEVGEGLEYKIKAAAESSTGMDELLFSIKSKRYPMSRIKRILMKALIGIKKDDCDAADVPVRVLAVKKEKQNLLSEIAANCRLVINPKNCDAMKKSVLASDIYACIAGYPAKRDFRNFILT